MNSPKDAAFALLKELPQTATFDDIMYGLYVRSKIENALAEADAGNLIDHAKVEQSMEQWLTE